MKSSLHGHDIFSAQLSKDELSRMAFNCRHGEIRYLAIGELVAVGYFWS